MSIRSLIRPAPLLASLAALATAAVCLLATLAAPDPGGDRSTPAGASVRTGLGHRSNGEFVGFYVTHRGVKVYCLSPRLATPRTVSLHTVHRYPGLSTAATAALAYALATWGDARTRDAAAVESQVANTLAGNHKDVARRARGLSPALRRLTAAHVAQAKALRGPYRVRLSTPTAPLPGVTAGGTVRVTSAAGRPVAGVPVALRGSANVRVSGSVRTRGDGSAGFTYATTSVGSGRVDATVRGLAGTGVGITTPRRGEQRMAAATGRVSAAGSATFRPEGTGFGHRYACDSECAGRPAVTLTACAPASRAASRIVYRAGAATYVRTFPAASRRHCESLSPRLADGTRVTAAWQFASGRGWGAPLPAPGSFVVDCPPTPAVAVTMTHDCATARVTISSSPSRHATRLLITGSRRATVAAGSGRSASWTVSAPCGSALALTFRAAAQRANGGWNAGPAAGVTTP